MPDRQEVRSIAAATCLLWAVSGMNSARAADLDERIAELDATAARGGNRKVSFSTYGLVNQAILLWDDGAESNAYIAGNAIDSSNFGFVGAASIAPGWKSGYQLEWWLEDNLTERVDQTHDNARPGFRFWQSHWFIESEALGKISLGLASRASDGAPEVDLSGSDDAAFAGVQPVGGNFALRRSDGDLARTVWSNVYDHFNGDTADVVRYDSPAFRGFTFVASWGEDDIWDAGLHYAGEMAGFKIGGAAAYTHSSDENGIDGSGGPLNSTVMGSFSVLHEATGLSATLAAGHREFDAAVADNDGIFRTPADARFVYVKLGWLGKLNGLGATAVYGEWGRFKDYVSAGLDAELVASLSFTDTASVCGAAGDACRVTGNEAEAWGLGVVQHIDAAGIHVYLGFRRHSAGFEIADVDGTDVAAAKVEDFDTLIAGSKIAF